MEGAIKTILKTKVDIEVHFHSSETISFNLKSDKKSATFYFHHTNEKLPRLIELFGRSKQNVNMEIHTSDYNKKLLIQSLKTLEINHMICRFANFHYFKLFKKENKSWTLDIQKYEVFPNSYVPFLCANISRYDVLVGIKVEPQTDRAIQFVLQAANNDIIIKQEIQQNVTHVDFWIENEKINIECISKVVDYDFDEYKEQETKLSKHRFGIHDFDCMRLDLLLVNGLAGWCGSWSDFLVKGLYDPRLFLLVAAFFNEKLCL